MRRPKLLVFLAVWQRPVITKICFMGLERLRKNFNVDAFAVISEESMKPLCKKYSVDYCMHENLPLGSKKNYGLTQAMKKDFDFLVEIGSDDLLKDEFMDLYSFDRDVFGLRDFAMIDTQTGDCRRLSDRDARFGLGRAISKDAIESFRTEGVYKLWADGISKGLDNDSTFALARKGYLEKRISTDDPVAIDLKSSVNIWPFNHLMGIEYPIEKALNGLSEKEKVAIKSLYAPVE